MWNGGTNATNHAQFREYWNSVGRWLQPDPYSSSYDYRNPQSFHRYAYVLNSPLTFIDLSGLVRVYNGIINDAGGGGCFGEQWTDDDPSDGGANFGDDVWCPTDSLFGDNPMQTLVFGPGFVRYNERRSPK
jgi:RHS repeat-associated protein